MIGAVAPYFMSYYPESTLSEVNSLFSTNIFFSMFGNFIGSKLFKARLVHPKVLVLIGGVIGISGIYTSSL